MSELSEKQKGRLLLSKKFGIKTFNNPVGCADYGDFKVSYGLKKGAPDNIGWWPITITPEMVGHKVAIFLGIEWKKVGKKPSPEQLEFLGVLKRDGAICGIANSPEDAVDIITRWEHEKKTQNINQLRAAYS